MRLATFNVESLDLPPKAPLPLETRAAVLRPALERLDADILCLQEVNGQHVQGSRERRLVALDRLLEGTRYEHYERAATSGPAGTGVADVHNLVTLSRFPFTARREIRHAHVQPLQHTMITGTAAGGPAPVHFDRPLLLTRFDLPGGRAVAVINVHLRAPLASVIPGEKSGHFTWRSIRGWAEGYYLSALKRAGQALELRLLVDELLADAPHALVAVAGDFNAEDHETPLRLAVGAEEDTGASELAAQSLAILDRSIAQDRRWSVLHHGRPQMLDHILASHALYGRFRHIEVHNELLADEAVGFAKSMHAAASYHAPLVAQFDLDSD
ncbi:MAG: endonuclease [Hyphomicrobiaceae bacterium]|nr:MAG: endonuclease [Hyphomicrobiaceae bacterium]